MSSERARAGRARGPGSLLCVATVALVMGCGMNSADEGDPTPGAGTGGVTYDLTEPPTRDEVGMAAGKKVVTEETDRGRPVTIALPGGRRLSTEVNLVTFDSFGAGLEAETADPTGMDMHTPRMGLPAATGVLRESLRQLGGSRELAESWRRAAESAAGTEIVRSENVPHELGYLTVRVQGRYNPVDEQASIAYILFWG